MEALIEKLNLSKNVFLKGFTNDPATIYKKALFSVLSSKTEGFPLAFLESMANGTPVISYDIKYGPRDIIDHGENGLLVPKNDKVQLAEAMIKLFKNPDLALAMGEKSRSKVERDFSKEKFTALWQQAIETAIENRDKRINKLSAKPTIEKIKWKNKSLYIKGKADITLNTKDSNKYQYLKYFLYIKTEDGLIDSQLPISTQMKGKKLNFECALDMTEFLNTSDDQSLELYFEVALYNFNKRFLFQVGKKRETANCILNIGAKKHQLKQLVLVSTMKKRVRYFIKKFLGK